jgi:hypothetical protein
MLSSIYSEASKKENVNKNRQETFGGAALRIKRATPLNICGVFLDVRGRPAFLFLRLRCSCLKYSGLCWAVSFPRFRPSLTAAGSFFLWQNSEDVALARNRIMRGRIGLSKRRTFSQNSFPDSFRVAEDSRLDAKRHTQNFLSRPTRFRVGGAVERWAQVSFTTIATV